MTCDAGIGFDSSDHILFAMDGDTVSIQRLANHKGNNTLTAEPVTRKMSLKRSSCG